MTQRRILFAVLLTSTGSATGCAAVHPGLLAQVETQRSGFVPLDKEKADLVLSAKERDDSSSEQFGVIDITLENRSQDFVTFRVLDLHFESGAEPGPVVPSGAELAAWVEGSNNELALSAVNRGWARAMLAGAGAPSTGSTSQPALLPVNCAQRVGTCSRFESRSTARPIGN
ncbi:MAG: hypothetical protein IPK13_05695 [Deltaproteobacteria bacterium]|nr:hypothetical protein [Deltaproteobacteria bacterium]